MKKGVFGFRSGFTIIEVTVVIFVIAIISSIAIVSYSSLTKQAVEASLKSDLASASEQLKIYKAKNNGSYPDDYAIDCSATPAANTVCFKASSGNTIPTLLTDNSANPKTFCIRAKNANGTNYFITESTNPALGVCPGVPQTQTFAYTGSEQQFQIPTDVYTVSIDAYGAAGVGGNNHSSGGLGGHVKGNLAVTPGSQLYLYVGGQGGYNGGRYGGGGGGSHPSCGGSDLPGGNGGGGTDARYGGNGTSNRKIVAGGGGGGGGDLDGGDCVWPDYPGGDGANGGSGGGCGTYAGCGTGGGGGGGGGYVGGTSGGTGYDSGASGGNGGTNYTGGVTGSTTYSSDRSGNGQIILYWETPS